MCAVVHIKNGDHLFGNYPSQIEYILLQHDKSDLDGKVGNKSKAIYHTMLFLACGPG